VARLTRDRVSEIVLGVLRREEGTNNITEATRFGYDLRVDSITLRTYYQGILKAMESENSRIKDLSPAKLMNLKTVGELVNLVHGAQAD
jgi:acyl carrier protein